MKKKIFVILGIFIITLLFIAYLLYNYKNGINIANQFNKQYEQYYQKETLGNNLATLINKAIDDNEKNGIEKDQNNLYYLNNNQNSVQIEIKFNEKEDIIRMEDIARQDIQNFIKYYSAYTFKCTKIEYHQKSGRVQKLYFEQT